MRCDEQENGPHCLVKEAIIVFPDTIVEPHAVVIKGRDAFVAILAMHGVLVYVGLADPTILGLFSLLVAVPVRVHSFAWVWCIIKMLVELWVYAIGLGCGVAVVHTNHTGCDEYNCCRYADRKREVGREEEAELRNKDRKQDPSCYLHAVVRLLKPIRSHVLYVRG